MQDQPQTAALDIYGMGDQPQTCPRCGCRTHWEDFRVFSMDEPLAQFHWCPNPACGYTFKVIE